MPFKLILTSNIYFETSAKSGENVEDVFIMAAKVLYDNFKDKIQKMVIYLILTLLQKEETNAKRKNNAKLRAAKAKGKS